MRPLSKKPIEVYVESSGSFNELVVSLLTSESFLYRTVHE